MLCSTLTKITHRQTQLKTSMGTKRYHIVYRLPKDENIYAFDYSKTLFQSHGDRIADVLTKLWGKPMREWDITIDSLTKIY